MCAEADALSTAANNAGVKTIAELREMATGSTLTVSRVSSGKPMSARSSCAHVEEQLGIKDMASPKPSGASVAARGLGILSIALTALQMSHLKSCTAGSMGQCFCALQNNMMGWSEKESDSFCGAPEMM
jgi:hypothetical protein